MMRERCAHVHEGYPRPLAHLDLLLRCAYSHALTCPALRISARRGSMSRSFSEPVETSPVLRSRAVVTARDSMMHLPHPVYPDEEERSSRACEPGAFQLKPSTRRRSRPGSKAPAPRPLCSRCAVTYCHSAQDGEARSVLTPRTTPAWSAWPWAGSPVEVTFDAPHGSD